MSNFKIVCPPGFDVSGTSCIPNDGLAWSCKAQELTIDKIQKNQLFNLADNLIPDKIELGVGDITKQGCGAKQFDFTTPETTLFPSTCYDSVTVGASEMTFTYAVNVDLPSNRNNPSLTALDIANNHFKYNLRCKGNTRATASADLDFDYLTSNADPDAGTFNNFPDDLIVISADTSGVKLNDQFTLTIANKFDATVHAIVDKCYYTYNTDAGNQYKIYERCNSSGNEEFVDSTLVSWSTTSSAAIAPQASADIVLTAFVFATSATGDNALKPTVHCEVQFCNGSCPITCNTAG